MNNITQVKRGTTASWSLGPELVHWEKLNVWGKDSLIHCEDADLEMFVRTSSANYFYDENGNEETSKRPGLWLIQRGEIPTDSTRQYKIKLKTVGPPDCWLEFIDTSGTLSRRKFYLGGAGRTDEITVSNFSNFGLYIRWEKEGSDQMYARIKLSIREVGAYEKLAPGQLGVEYTDDGKVRLKAGKPGRSNWNDLPYISGDSIGFGEILVGENILGTKNKVEFVFEVEKGVFAKVRPLGLVQGRRYKVELIGPSQYSGTLTASLDEDGDISLYDWSHGSGGEEQTIIHIKTNGNIKLGQYRIDYSSGWATFEEGQYIVNIVPMEASQIQTIEPQFLPLPNPEHVQLNGQGLAIKNGQWVLTSSPVITSSDVISLVTGYDAKFAQIEEELAQLRAMLNTTPAE